MTRQQPALGEQPDPGPDAPVAAGGEDVTSVAKRAIRGGPRTRAALIDTAIELISRNGIEAVSVLELTQTLGISNGSFYYHFENMDHLLEVAGKTVVDNLVGQIGKIKRADPAARIVAGPLIILGYIDQNPVLQPILLRVIEDRASRHEDIAIHLRQDLENGQKLHRFAIKDIEAPLHFVRAIIGSAIRMKGLSPGNQEINYAASQHLLTMLGIPAWEAIQIVEREAGALSKV